MKTLFLTSLVALASLTVSAQTTIKAPVVAYVEIPVQTNNNSIFITTNVTNVYMSTNAPAQAPLVTLTSDVVDARLGARLIRFLGTPPNFTFTNFAPGSFLTLYWSNPAQFPITFPTKGVWWMGQMPTNQARGAVLIEKMGDEYWITP